MTEDEGKNDWVVRGILEFLPPTLFSDDSAIMSSFYQAMTGAPSGQVSNYWEIALAAHDPIKL